MVLSLNTNIGRFDLFDLIFDDDNFSVDVLDILRVTVDHVNEVFKPYIDISEEVVVAENVHSVVELHKYF